MPSPGLSDNNRPGFQRFRLSLVSFAVLGCLLGATATSADATPTETWRSAPFSPLLADARSDGWKPHNERYREQPRQRHQEPPRDKSKGQYRERERHPEPNRSTHKERDRYSNEVRHYDRDDYRRWREHDGDRHRHEPRYSPPPPRARHYAPPPGHRHSRDIVIVRPFRYDYPRHHHHHLHGDEIWGWLTFTAITLAILDNLNERQQREHETALYSAAAAPLGETIYWRDGNASGAITPIQDGTSSAGRYCREFQQEVNIGGKAESLYGTACQNPDGSWEIVQ